MEYRNPLKITYAASLLEQEGHLVTEVVLECEFDNLSYFIRTFKKMTEQYELSLSRLCGHTVLIHNAHHSFWPWFRNTLWLILWRRSFIIIRPSKISNIISAPKIDIF